MFAKAETDAEACKIPFICDPTATGLDEVDDELGEDDELVVKGAWPADLKRSCELRSSFKTGISMDLRMLRCS